MRRPNREDFPYFDNTLSSINLEELIPGCARPDCIPSIDNPEWMISPESYSLDEEVLVLLYKDEVYVVSKYILNVHEIINLTATDGTPLSITYCPLCQTEKAYLRKVDDDVIELGVSGLLWNSALVLYDRQSLSLFSQVLSRGIVGKYVDVQLTEFPILDTTIKELIRFFPSAKFLSKNTGSKRSKHYSSNPYGNYESTDRVMFPLKYQDTQLPIKERVFVIGGKIIPQKSLHEDLVKLWGNIFCVKVAGFPVFFRGECVNLDSKNIDEFTRRHELEWIPADYCFYFTARAYHPTFEVINDL